MIERAFTSKDERSRRKRNRSEQRLELVADRSGNLSIRILDRPKIVGTAHPSVARRIRCDRGVRIGGHKIAQDRLSPQRQSGGHGDPAVLLSGRLERRCRPVLFDHGGGDVERLVGGQKVAEFDASHLGNQHQRVAKIIGHPDQPHRRLGQRLEHHDAGHDGKTRKVIAKVLLVSAQSSRRHDLAAGRDRDDAVELPVFHAA